MGYVDYTTSFILNTLMTAMPFCLSEQVNQFLLHFLTQLGRLKCRIKLCPITNIDYSAFLTKKHPQFISITSQAVSEKGCHFASVCALIPSCVC